MFQARENNNNNGERREGRERLIAVAIDKDKSSQRALRWAIENFITRGQTVRLVHVIPRPPSNSINPDPNNPVGIDDNQISEFFLPFRCYCSRRQINSEAVILEDPDVAKALIEYVAQCGIETLLLGSASKSGISRLFKGTDVPGSVLKWAPDFCNVYVISKGKVGPVRSATRPVPNIRGDGLTRPPQNLNNIEAPSVIDNVDGLLYDELVPFDDQNDFSWASSGSWASSDGSISSFYENLVSLNNNRPSISSNGGCSSLEYSFNNSASKLPGDAGTTSSSECVDQETNDEMRRLRIELKQTMDMYHAACKEALAAKQKVMELQEWKRKEENRTREAHPEEEEASTSSLSIAEKDQKATSREAHPEEEEEEAEASTSSSSSSTQGKDQKARCKGAFELAIAAQKFIELEVQKRVDAERKALTRRLLLALDQSHIIVKYQSLFHIVAVLFLFYFYLSI